MPDAHLIEHTLSSTSVFNGSFFQVLRDQVKLPDGNLATREYITHPGAVAIIAIDDDHNIILERQFRHPIQEVLIEVPAGKIDPNEEILTCGKRELLEETGYTALNWHWLGSQYPCIGYSNEQIHYYLVTDLELVAPSLDEGEFIEVIKLPIAEAFQLAFSGQIKDSKTVAGLMLYYGYLNSNQ